MNEAVDTTLIRGGLLPDAGPADILVRGRRIAAIGTDLPLPRGAATVDARGRLIYPGLVNTHHHLAQSLLKGVPAGINQGLSEWLGSVPYRTWPHFTPETLYTAAVTGFSELLRAGCTTCADHHYLYHHDSSPALEDALFDAAEAVGIRLVLCRGGSTVNDRHRLPDGSPIRPETLDRFLARLEETIGRRHDSSAEAMTRVAVAPTSLVHSSSPDQLRAMADFARDQGVRLHSHLLEVAGDDLASREKYGLSAIDLAESVGWLGPDVWFAHMVHADPETIARLGASGTGIAHCPSSNCRLGSGIAPVPDLEKAGVRISLGVDGSASAESGSPVNELLLSWLLHRATGGPHTTSVEQVLGWGTRGGAEVLGFEALGELRPGAIADLAIYDLDQPRFAGLWEPRWAPVICGEPITAESVMINGDWRVRGGQVVGIDPEKLRAESIRQRDYLKERYG